LLIAVPASSGGNDSILRQVGNRVNVARKTNGPALDSTGPAGLTFRAPKKREQPAFFGHPDQSEPEVQQARLSKGA